MVVSQFRRALVALSPPALALLAVLSASSVPALAKGQIFVFWRENGPEMKALQEAAVAFQKKYDIGVKFASGSEDKFFAMVMSGSNIDLFSSVLRSGITDYAKRGFCLDLTPYIKRDKFPLTAFYGTAVKRLKMNGQQIGIPLGGSVSGLYCNADMFASAGAAVPPADWATSDWTWEDFLATGKKLSKDTNGDGKLDQVSIDLDMYNSYAAASLTWLWGGDFFTQQAYDSGVAPKSSLDTPATIAALQKLIDLKLVHRIWGKPGDVSGGNILGGKVAMQQGGLWIMTANEKVKSKYNLAAAVLPRGTARTPIVYTDPWLIFKSSKNKDGAWKWIRFMTLEEGATIFSKGYVGQMLTKRGTEDLTKRLPTLKNLAEVVDGAWKYGEESPNHRLANYGEIDSIINTGLAPLWSCKVDAITAVRNTAPKLDALMARTFARFNK